MIYFRKFRKSYGRSLILRIDELRIDAGIYWIKGINGSGKTTLLKTLAGILDFEGDIIIDNQLSVKRTPVGYRRIINFAEAEPIYPGFLSGTDMIKLFCQAKGAYPDQPIKYLEEMKMNDYISEPISIYSSGMLKKLSIVLAFLGQPKWILLDEPLITLDDESVSIVYRWIKDLHDKKGVGFLLSSHQDIEAGGSKVKQLLVNDKCLSLVS